MRNQQSTGLSSADYQSLTTKIYDNPNMQYILSRYNLLFGDKNTHAITNSKYFDACVGDGLIIKAVNGTVYSSPDGINWTQRTTYLAEQVSPSLLYEDGTFYLYYTDTGRIAKKTSLDGITWTEGTILYGSFVGIQHIAASRADRVHVVVRNDTYGQNNHFFCYDVNNIIESDIYWPHVIDSFDAIKVDGIRDSIVITSNLPILLAQRSTNVNVSEIRYQSGGVVSFIYAYDEWSQHYEMEVFDNISPSLARKAVKLSRSGDYVFATCYGTDGTDAYYVQGTLVFRSKDGKYWEQSKHYPVVNQNGSVLLVLGDYAHLIAPQNSHTSDSTDFSGHRSSSVETDITSYVTASSRNVGQVSQGSLTLANQGNQIYRNTVLDANNVFHIDWYLGFYSYDAGKPLRIHYATDIVLSHSTNEAVGRNNLEVRTADWMWYLTEGIKAYHVIENRQSTIGYDDFLDDTSTGYGGLRHTATQQGTWRTGLTPNTLTLVSNNKVGTAFNTYEIDPWSAFQQVIVTFPALPPGFAADSTSDMWGGIIFRAYDTSNFWAFVLYKPWDETVGKVQMLKYSGGQKEVIFEQTLNQMWPEIYPLTEYKIPYGKAHGLMVRLRYNKVELYGSVDGKNWWPSHFLQNEFNISGQFYANASPGVIDVERGYFGYIGRGVTVEESFDNFETPYDETPPPVVVENPVDLPVGGVCSDVDWSQYDPGTGPASCINQDDSGFGTVFALGEKGLYRTTEFNRAEPDWDIVADSSSLPGYNSDTFVDFVIDPFCDFEKGTGDQITGYLLSSQRLWLSIDLEKESPTWAMIRVIQNGEVMRAPRGDQGFLIIHGNSSGAQPWAWEYDFDFTVDDWDEYWAVGEQVYKPGVGWDSDSPPTVQFGTNWWYDSDNKIGMRNFANDDVIYQIQRITIEFTVGALSEPGVNGSYLRSAELWFTGGAGPGNVNIAGTSEIYPTRTSGKQSVTLEGPFEPGANYRGRLELNLSIGGIIEDSDPRLVISRIAVAGTGFDPFLNAYNEGVNMPALPGSVTAWQTSATEKFITVLSGYGSVVHTNNTFGEGPFLYSKGMDVDDYNDESGFLIRAAGRDGGIYEQNGSDEPALISGTLGTYGRTMVRVWNRKLTGATNNTENSLHGASGFTELGTHEWTQDDWSFNSGAYSTVKEITVENEVLQWAGVNAYETYAGDSTVGAGVAHNIDGTRYFLITTNQTITNNLNGRVDSVNGTILELSEEVVMLTMGTRSPNNLYLAGPTGVFFSSNGGTVLVNKSTKLDDSFKKVVF